MKKLVGITFLMFALVPSGWAQNKKRVAVLDFDYATVRSYVSSIFGTDVDVGKGIADMMVTRLVNDGAYSVIERKALDKILNEQNFSNSDRANPDTAAKIGRVLGVEAIIIGSITQFGRDDKQLGVGGGAMGGVTGRFGLGRVGQRQAKAVVGINARMVNTETGEILAAVEGKGESKRSGLLLGGAGGGGGGGGGGGVDMGSSNFANTILGEAVGQAVTDVARQLDDKAASLPAPQAPQISGLVADVSGNTLILNVGSKAGVQVGAVLGVFRQGRQIKDPATGKVLKTIETKLGDVTITEVEDTSSTGNYVGQPTKMGDVVRNSQ